LQFVLIDPKRLEFEPYSRLPHLYEPVAQEAQDAVDVLEQCVAQMEHRYRIMAQEGVRDINAYNAKLREAAMRAGGLAGRMTRLVIVVDELADLMIQLGKEVEPLILRIAQKGRAAGLHLVLATQRPSREVITGVVKANIPTRVSFQVNTGIDSRCILDEKGAEQLLGKGDMLVKSGTNVRRIHGAFISEPEVSAVCDALSYA
jgi:S-DNA-T family DNA segregation ATPase FtsK/SpoIIIE